MTSAEELTPKEREELRKKRQLDVQTEINEMDEGIFHSDSSTPELEVTTEEVTGSEVETETESELGPELDLLSVTAPEEEVKSEDDEEYDFNFINEMARTAIAKMDGVSVPEVAPPPTPAAVAPVPAPTPVVPPINAVDDGLVSVEEMEEAFDSPQKMVMLMQKVYARAKADALAEASQSAVQASMRVIDHAEKIRDFYHQNSELKPYHDFVRFCARQVEAKHPDWGPDKVAVETAKLAKRQIPNLRRAAQDSRRPALPGAGGGAQRKSKTKVSGIEQEIAAMPDYF